MVLCEAYWLLELAGPGNKIHRRVLFCGICLQDRKTSLQYQYCIIYAEQHQAFDDFGCSREVLFLEGSFSMVNVLGGGDFFAARER